MAGCDTLKYLTHFVITVCHISNKITLPQFVIQNMSKKPAKLNCHTLQLDNYNHMYPSSYNKEQNRSYLHFHKTYGHHTWQTSELSLGTTINKVTWPCDYVATWSHVANKKRYISTSMRPMRLPNLTSWRL